jgi:hypothetical protein
MRRCMPWVLVLITAGCPPPGPGFPGDEVMGVFAFTAHVTLLPDGSLDPAWQDCLAQSPPINEIPTADFTFEGTFSRDRGSGAAWLTLNGVPRPAAFDGQYVTSSSTADRQFKAYGDGGQVGPGQVTETLRVALLSRSQSQALGGACPPDALSGGLPQGHGVTPPGSTPTGFDALLACGVLVDGVAPEDGGGTGAGCTLRYPLTGIRR